MSRTLRSAFNEANPNKLPDVNKALRMGEAMALLPRFVQGAVTSNVLSLPDEAKAGQVLVAFARAGTSTGYKTAAAPHSTPGAGAVAVNAAGDIEFNGTDAVTAAEVLYVAAEGDVIEEEIDVAADGTASFLQSREGVVLLEAELLSGDSVGDKTVIARGSAPAAGQAALDLLGQPVFNATDVGANVERARVKYVARPGAGAGVDDAVGTTLDAQQDI